MQTFVKEISFEEITPFWSERLWPQRESPIEPVSAIDLDGRYNMTLMSATPYFWGFFQENMRMPLGVISGFKTSPDHFRSRGIWVSDAVRNQGIGQKLLQAVEAKALTENCGFVWSMPRKISWYFYHKNHFEILKEIDTFEFGPHYLAIKTLK